MNVIVDNIQPSVIPNVVDILNVGVSGEDIFTTFAARQEVPPSTADVTSRIITLNIGAVEKAISISGTTAEYRVATIVDGAWVWGDWTADASTVVGLVKIQVKIDAAIFGGIFATATLSIADFDDRVFTVTTIDTLNDLVFTAVGYNATWTPPSITAALLADANVTWRRPDGTTFTGKAPAMTNFEQLGEYRCHVSDWSKVTSFAFNPGSVQAWISHINLGVMFPKMTGLTTLAIRNQSALVDDITNWVVPSTVNNLALYLYTCDNIVGDITDFVYPPNVVSIQGIFSGATKITGVFPNPGSLASCTNYSGIVKNNILVTGDVSTWGWRSNISPADMASTGLTYGTGQSLRSNVKNGLIFSLDNCNLPTADVGRVLIDINISGATGAGGSIALNTNDGAPDWGTEGSPSDVAYAVADLIFKSWSSISVTGGIPAWVSAL